MISVFCDVFHDFIYKKHILMNSSIQIKIDSFMLFKSKLRVHLYFIIVNAFIAMLIACRYFVYLSEFPTDILGFSFLVSSVISHMTLLMVLLGIILIPFLLLPRR